MQSCRGRVWTVFALVTLWLRLTPVVHAEFRWNSAFTAKYRSAAEGRDVSFGVRTPPRIEGMKAYPLIVVLNGGPRVSPSAKYPYFQVRPSRNRIWGYRSLSTYDVMQVVAYAKRQFPIDPNRVYLVGSSAGASGAMHLASCYPDEFAAVLPLIAAGNNYPLWNFSNLPVAFHHGDRDWVSAICNVRVQAQRMRTLVCPTILKEYRGAGHGIPGSHEPLMDWLFKQRRNPAPQKIRHECEVPSLGRSYWLRVREFDDPHKRATIKATITGEIATIEPKNVIAFSLNRKLVPKLKQVRIGNAVLAINDDYRIQNGQWRIAKKPIKNSNRQYEAGGAANLYQGEPLIVVYGTAGRHADLLRTAAQKLAGYGGPIHTAMRSRFPVVADTALTAKQQARCNLILIGTPDENVVTAAVSKKLPVTLKKNVLMVKDRTPLKLRKHVLGLLAKNPNHPERLVYVLAPFVDMAGLRLFSRQPQLYLAGSDGFDRVSQPDLIVQDLDRLIARQMQYGKDWRWRHFQGDKTFIPDRFRNRANLAQSCMKLMRSRSRADFALWWGPADKGMWGADFNHLQRYDPANYTLADFRTQHRVCETMLGTVSGAELKDIWDRWGRNRELISRPKISFDLIDKSKQYSLHIPMDLYIKLGRRKKNLLKPKPGPEFAAEDLIPIVFNAR